MSEEGKKLVQQLGALDIGGTAEGKGESKSEGKGQSKSDGDLSEIQRLYQMSKIGDFQKLLKILDSKDEAFVRRGENLPTMVFALTCA